MLLIIQQSNSTVLSTKREKSQLQTVKSHGVPVIVIQRPEPQEGTQGGARCSLEGSGGFSQRLGGHFLGQTDHALAAGLALHILAGSGCTRPRAPGASLHLVGKGVALALQRLLGSRPMGPWPGDGEACLWRESFRSSVERYALPGAA